MADLKSKVLAFVEAQADPVPISDIAKGISCDPTATQKVVLELHKEGVLFRSVLKGKALFSADSRKGEGLTPVQHGNARVTRTIGAAKGGKPMPSSMSEDVEDDDEPHRPFNIKLTFNQGKRLELKDYSIGVPDGFEYKTDINGRDFVIWMPPTEGLDDLDSNGVPVMSPFVLMEAAQRDKPSREEIQKAIQKVQIKKAYAYVLASGILQQNLMGTVPVVLDTQNIAALYQKTLMTNYSVHLIFNDYMKAFTCRIDPTMEPSSDKETACFESALASWIDTVELRDPYPVRKPMDSPEFFKNGVTKAAIGKWSNYAAEWINQFTFLCTTAIQYEIYRYRAIHPIGSFTGCKSKLLPHLEAERDNYNKMITETLNCVEQYKSVCDPGMLSSLCKQALEIAANDECFRIIDDNKIKLTTDAPKIRKRIKEISGISSHKLQQGGNPSGQGAQPAQKKPQANLEKEAAQKKPQIDKQTLRKSVGIVRDNLHKELEERIKKAEQESTAKIERAKKQLAKMTQAEADRCGRELEAIRDQVEALSGSLQFMGLFQFKQKSEAKAKLKQLEQEIGQLEQACRNPDSEDIKKAKSKLEHAEKNQADIAGMRTKWENAVKEACSEFECRVNLYVDYAEGKEMVLASSLGITDWKEWEWMQAIYSVAFFATVMDMQQQSYKLSELDHAKMASLVKRMVDKGYLTMTKSGGQYHFDEDKPLPEQVVDDTGWDIKKPPAAPNIDDILAKI